MKRYTPKHKPDFSHITRFMDPISAISLSSSLLGLITQATTLVSGLCNYYDDVKNAPIQAQQLRYEFEAVVEILKKLQILDVDSLSSDSGLEKAINNFQALLNELKPCIAKNCTEGLKRLRWPFTKAEHKRLSDQIERYKATFSLALTIDQTYFQIGILADDN